MLNLNNFITNLVISSFNKQLKQSLKMKNKLNDFLKNKIIFAFTSLKAQKLLNAITMRDASCAINSRLQSFVAIVSSSISLFFASSLKRTTLSRSHRHRFISLFALLSYFLS